ncbi:MAG TPA: glucoamylase family protein [Phycisphaerae bacterium]|nr:glucoamylase family protein [Phycisphaerae bacterium]
MKNLTLLKVMTAVVALSVLPAGAAIETSLASYEPDETDLTVTANPGDSGLSVSIVQGGVGGAPSATDGDYVLEVDFVGENGKVEFTHDWSASSYNLAGEDVLLADVYIATSSALPSIMGIWDPSWNPPDAWQSATGIPWQVGVWTTISFSVSARSQTGLDQIWAFIFEGMPGSTGTAYVDNLRFSHAGAPYPTGAAATAFEDRIEVVWRASSDAGLQGYNIYRATSESGPFGKLNGPLLTTAGYTDPVGQGSPRYFYYVTSVIDGVESDPSDVASALYNGLTDSQLLDLVQETTLGYFWDYGHPTSGMIREGYNLGHSTDTVTAGGTGMGLMTIVVGAERGFITRSAAAGRVLQILSFLNVAATRYHGAWSHHLNGVTGETIPFAGPKDNGGDLVETAFLIQGMLTARQYFDDPTDPAEIQIRALATSMWEGVEWDWYRQYPSSDVLYWHWSPDYGWDLNMQIRGYNEAQIVYLLAIASPTHPMPASSYANGWAGDGWYANGNTYYGYPLWVGPALGGPLFFTHYSNLGFDPRYKRDAYCNYFENSRNISLIDQAYCMDNPNEFAGYSEVVWGLTASFDPWGYLAHSPTADNGTITPTAAISAMPYTPEESLVTLRHLYDAYGDDLWGIYGFYDAFNLGENWFAAGYVAIDEGTIVPMIENYRSGLCWRLFMSNPEIKPMLQDIGWTFTGDLNGDGEIDLVDYGLFADCMTGPGDGALPPGCSDADFDGDGRVDLKDVTVFQEVFAGP